MTGKWLMKKCRQLFGKKFHVLTWKLSFLRHSFELRLVKMLFKIRTPNGRFIAISQIEHMGDIVAAEPITRYLKIKYPNSSIVWFVLKTYRELLEFNPAIDRIVEVACMTEWIRFSQEKLFDEIFDLRMEGWKCPVCLIPSVKPKGSGGLDYQNYYQEGRNLLRVSCQSAGLEPIYDTSRLYIPAKVVSKVDSLNLPENFISIHGESNDSFRNWDISKWKSLAENTFRNEKIHIVEVGSKNLLQSESPYYLNLCGKTSILETAEIIKRSRIFVGVDSGPAHLANAVGTFGMILLGRYKDIPQYMPFNGGYEKGHAAFIYSDGPASEISVERVYQSLIKNLTNYETQ